MTKYVNNNTLLVRGTPEDANGRFLGPTWELFLKSLRMAIVSDYVKVAKSSTQIF